MTSSSAVERTARLTPKNESRSSRYLVANRIDSSLFIKLFSPFFIVRNGDASDVFVGLFVWFGGVFDNNRFFGFFEFFHDGLIGGSVELIELFVEHGFLLDDGDEVADEVVKREGANKVNHDEQHHDGHELGHLARDYGVELGLVWVFAVGGFFHDLLEGLFLGGGWDLLLGNPVLREG